MYARLAYVVLAATGLAALADDPSVLPPAKTFTLQSDSTSLSAVLDELAKQTGVVVDRAQAEADRALRLNCQKLNFWDALEKIAREADHRIQFSNDGRRVMLVGGGDITYKETPFCVDRCFRLSVRRVQSTIEFDNENAFTEVTMRLVWEPGLSVFLVDSPGRAAVAKDNTDQDLRIVEDNLGRLQVSAGGIDLPIRLSGVNRSAKTIRLLEGKFGIIGAAQMIEVNFDKTAASMESREVKKEGIAIRLRTDFKENSDLWTARVELEYPEGGPQLESFESSAWLVNNQAWLMSTDGKKKLENNAGYEVIGQSDRKAVVLYRFTDDVGVRLGKPEDWVFHVRTPTRLISADVKFRLENIPLP